MGDGSKKCEKNEVNYNIVENIENKYYNISYQRRIDEKMFLHIAWNNRIFINSDHGSFSSVGIK